MGFSRCVEPTHHQMHHSHPRPWLPPMSGERRPSTEFAGSTFIASLALCVAAAAQPNMTADLPMSTTSCDPGGTVQGATDEASQAASAGRGGKGRGGTDGRGGRGGRGCHSVPSAPPESLPGDGELSMIDLNLEQRPPLPVKPPAAAPISFAAAAAAAASRPMPLSAQPNAQPPAEK